MSITFRTLRWANFLSSGDNFTHVDLSSHRSTLIVGDNGSGKSTMLDALFFALFGKPHRSIKKGQLLNSVNQKGCIVEVEFTLSGSQHFLIRRGIKPSKFEIYRDGELVPQSATTREYQQYLETSILKMNDKSFRQIVVLGSSSFTPFMQLPAPQRREVIEDLLDIQVFSRMREILKDQLSALKDDIREVDHSIDLNRQKIDMQEKYVEDMRGVNEETINAARAAITQYQEEIEALTSTNQELEDWISSNDVDDQIQNLNEKRDKIKGYESQFRQEVATLVKEAKFYEENEVCPTCTQGIDPELREKKLSEAQERASQLQKGMDDAAEKSASLDEDIQRLRATARETAQARADLHANSQGIRRLQGQIRDREIEIERLLSKESDLSSGQEELESLKQERENLANERVRLLDEQQYKRACSEMLKDTGIKTKVVREYLPLMNQLINQYLQTLDFFVSFHLDENFDETIKSRHRDQFSYPSFSEGEKARINLALMFTWRQVARLKNTMSTNLLIMDEVFDSSLDYDGTDNLLKILNTLEEGTNTFVISHKGDEVLDNKFDRKMHCSKEGNFSFMQVVE
jgi:DNA repair exonuclease SbcCD ATPase subunit